MAGDLFDSLLSIVAKVDDAGIPYTLVGGLAVAVHGAPRATTDIDLLIDPSDADRAVEIAEGAGFAFEALPRQFNDGMRLRRVTRIEGGRRSPWT